MASDKATESDMIETAYARLTFTSSTKKEDVAQLEDVVAAKTSFTVCPE